MTAWPRFHPAAADRRAVGRQWPLVWLAAGCGGGVAILAAALGLADGLTYRELLNDPADTYGFSPAGGMVSNLGLMFWSAAAAVALVAWEVLRRRGGDARLRRFFLATSLFTAVLLVDDAFLLHEQVLPEAGIGERYIKAGYLGLALVYGLVFLRELMRDGGLVLLVPAGLFFAASFVFDNPALVGMMGLLEVDFVSYVIEDGAKFVGISLWLAFVARAAVTVLASRRF
ncbi:hypothetical protein [Arenibaculum sp.]|uniref:hypothetical protein n=1 Tax=Arenibaculum sp. TaxID=2865862 RepID=UPI002E0EE2CC|nr:hypothetical protein [Arenibaculum sp.]